MRVALIACCGKKADAPAPARELYRSPLFRKSVAWAERRGLPCAVLSARHGLVMPGDVLPPYDLTLARLPAGERAAWAARVNADLRRRLAGCEFVVLAGRLYRAALAGLPHTAPMAGLGIGRQLRWLTLDCS